MVACAEGSLEMIRALLNKGARADKQDNAVRVYAVCTYVRARVCVCACVRLCVRLCVWVYSTICV